MSLLDEVTTQQVVYGPDGKAYGNPAIARNAGVNQYYREDGTPYPVATPAASGMGSGDPYSQIMGQSGGVSPYERIMARMTPTMNPYGSVSGGYDPSFQGGYDPSLYSRLTRSGLINTGGGGGGGGGGSDYSDPNPAWSNMTQAERAAYYAANPTMASVTKGLQGLFGNTLYGKIQNYFNPNFVTEEGLIAMGVNPAAYQAAKESFRASEISDMNAAAEAAQVEAGRQAAQESFRSSEITQQNQDSTPSGGSYDSGDYGGYSGSETQSSGESYANFKGGMVTNVFGPNPAGPDDGAGMLQLGEYVIKKSAVKKYGQGLLDMINNGKIPAKKLKSLLG
jgi:hypothetical protein